MERLKICLLIVLSACVALAAAEGVQSLPQPAGSGRDLLAAGMLPMFGKGAVEAVPVEKTEYVEVRGFGAQLVAHARVAAVASAAAGSTVCSSVFAHRKTKATALQAASMSSRKSSSEPSCYRIKEAGSPQHSSNSDCAAIVTPAAATRCRPAVPTSTQPPKSDMRPDMLNTHDQQPPPARSPSTATRWLLRRTRC